MFLAQHPSRPTVTSRAEDELCYPCVFRDAGEMPVNEGVPYTGIGEQIMRTGRPA
jgi:hypothetical protein